MQKIIIPYDGSAAARRALLHLVDTIKGDSDVQVHVLNVQESPAYLDSCLDAATIEQIEQSIAAAGRKTVLEAAEVLQQASIPHQLHVHVGPIAETIAQQAAVLGCKALIMGTRGLGAFSGLLLGSVATKVIHLVDIPITLVK